MTYRQITSGERYMLAALRTQGLSASQIARQLGRHPSTISREVRRNSCNDGAYRPSKASRRTRGRRSRSRRNSHFSPCDFRLVNQHLRQDWSPEQVARTFRAKGLLSISHETIYQHVLRDKRRGGTLHTHLRIANKERKKRYGSYDSRGRLAGKRHISERPSQIESREEVGHWEIDTVMGTGSKDCILTLCERKTGLAIIGKLEDRTMYVLTDRMIERIRGASWPFLTFTSDNGTEFHDYRTIEAWTGTTFFFATPYHSWERGSSENLNGLIRQYLPKGTSMADLTQQKCNAIAHKLNTRPRKRLGFKTPLEAFNAL